MKLRLFEPCWRRCETCGERFRSEGGIFPQHQRDVKPADRIEDPDLEFAAFMHCEGSWALWV